MNSTFEIVKQRLGDENISENKPYSRYGMNLKMSNGEERLCFFTAPIFNENGLVERKFEKSENGFCFRGSNGEIMVSSSGVLVKNKAYQAKLRWEKEQRFTLSENAGCLRSESMEISPTLNGVLVAQKYEHRPLYFWFESDSKYKGFARMNTKYFAYMKEQYVPYVTLNTVWASDEAVCNMMGADLAMKKDSETQFRFRMTATDPKATKLNWEINLYEPKLIQDTTVESRRPNENNVYGNIAFLGETPDHGVQYLYSRFDLDKIKLDPTKRAKRVFLHVPCYNTRGSQKLCAASPIRRFCSFGSNWANKMPTTDFSVKYRWQNGCFVFDLSDYMLSESGKWKENTGIVLRLAGAKDVLILATADNYNMPQMIEIEYERE